MIICQCNAVTDRSVARAFHAGARSIAQVSRTTDAGRVCGSCVSTVKSLLNTHQATGCRDCGH